MKKVLALVLVAVLLLIPMAIAQESLAGSWELDIDWVLEMVAETYGMTADDMKTLLEQAGMNVNDLLGESGNVELLFNEDGTGSMTYDGVNMEFTYYTEGTALFVQAINGEPEQWSYAFVDGQLNVVIPDGESYSEMVFSRRQESLVGTWKIDMDWLLEQSAAEAGMTVEEMKAAFELVGMDLNELLDMVTITFEENGTVITTADGETATAAYQIDGNKLTVISNGVSETSEFSLENGKLTMTIDGQSMVFSR